MIFNSLIQAFSQIKIQFLCQYASLAVIYSAIHKVLAKV